MGKIRGNPQTIALAHETRANLYHHLGNKEEMPTVELEKILQITRYHLYHHLKQLAKVGLIENHRDVGRAKWWRVFLRSLVFSILLVVTILVRARSSTFCPV